MRLGTKWIYVRLIVTIPTILRSSQGTNEGPIIYSLGQVSGRLPQAGSVDGVRRSETQRTLGRGHSRCRNDEKGEKGRRLKGLFDRRPEITTGIHPDRAYQSTTTVPLASTRQIKRPPPITCVGEAFKGLREGGARKVPGRNRASMTM